MPRTPAKAHALSFALLLGTSACASGGRVPTTPAPAAPVPAQPERIREPFQIAATPAARPVRGNLLGSARYDLPVEANRWVEMELDFLVNQRRAVIGTWLSRADRYQSFVQETFASYGIPRDLHHLAMVESGYLPTARSHAGAVGMWQFMTATGRGMGLRIDDVVDERMDPVRSTHAAARHLRQLHRDFRGDWPLAAAAYNAGSGRINRGLGRFGVTNFWDLAERGDLAQETRHYVPRLYAVTIIGRDPARFGYPMPAAHPFRPDSVRVDVETPIAELAKIAALPASEIAELNPHLVRGFAPAGYKVWTPMGSGPAIQAAYDTSTFRRGGGVGWYTLRRGENVAQVAAAAGITMERIRELNLSIAPERMRAGDRLRLPAPLVRTLSSRPVERERLASASDEPRGPSNPELDAARAEARRARAARREEELAREARQAEEREARRAEERARDARLAREREERAAARRLAAAEKSNEEAADRARRTSDSATTKVAAADEERPATHRASDSTETPRARSGDASTRRTSDSTGTSREERVAARPNRPDSSRTERSSTRRAEREDSSAERSTRTASRTTPRRTGDEEERAETRVRTHTVVRGETLRGLAEMYRVTVAQLRAANDIASGKGVEVGQRLRLPRAAGSSGTLATPSERAARARASDDEPRRDSTTRRTSTTERTASRTEAGERRTARPDSTRRTARGADEETPRRASSDAKSASETPRPRATTERRASTARDSSATRPRTAARDSSATRTRTASIGRDSSSARTRTASTGRDSSSTRSRAASAETKTESARPRTTPSETKTEGARTRASSSEGSARPRNASSEERETPRPSQHTVKSGETLYGIARQYGVAVPALRAANDMDADSVIQPGQKLRIPRS